MTAVRTLVALVPDWPVVAAGAAPGDLAATFHANRVVAATAAARAEGVETGMRRREAQARCPELAVLEHDPARDARRWEPVVAGLDDVCPRIEVAAPGRLAFPTRGPARYFGGDAALAEIVAGRAGAGVGIADGPYAALLAAGDAGAGAPLVVAPTASPAFLAPRPVADLLVAGLPGDLVDVLGRLGLRTLGAVAAVDPGDLAGRFGADGVAAHRPAVDRLVRWARARGIRPVLLDVLDDPRSIEPVHQRALGRLIVAVCATDDDGRPGDPSPDPDPRRSRELVAA